MIFLIRRRYDLRRFVKFSWGNVRWLRGIKHVHKYKTRAKKKKETSQKYRLMNFIQDRMCRVQERISLAKASKCLPPMLL